MSPVGNRQHRVIAILAVAVAMGSAAAAEVYRWTDADGQVHYGQRPPRDAAGARSIPLPQTTGPVGGVDPDGAQRRARQRRLLESYAHERQQKQAAETESAQRRHAQAQRCSARMAQWRRLIFRGRVYVEREDGTREYLSDEQRAFELARLRPAYVKDCGEAPP